MPFFEPDRNYSPVEFMDKAVELCALYKIKLGDIDAGMFTEEISAMGKENENEVGIPRFVIRVRATKEWFQLSPIFRKLEEGEYPIT